MNKIEKNKKEIGIFLLTFMILSYVATYIIVEDGILKVALSFASVVGVYFAVSMYKDAVIGVAKAFVNILVYSILTLAVHKISMQYEISFLPLFILSILSFSAIYFYIGVPKLIHKFLYKKINKRRAKKEVDKDSKILDYQSYKLAQNVKAYTNKKYAISNIDFKSKLNRVVFSIFALIFSVMFMLQGQSIYALIWFVYAITMLAYGIINGLLLPILLTFFVIICEVLKIYYYIEPNNFLQYYSVLSIILISVIALFSRWVLKIYKKSKEYINIQTFKVGENYNSCDVFLEAVAPISMYENLITFEVEIKALEDEISYNELRYLNRFTNTLYKEAVSDEFIIAGTSIDSVKQKLYVYVYVTDLEIEEVKQEVTKIANDYEREIKVLEEIKDPKWEYFFENIYPDKYITQEIINKNYIQLLKKINVKEDEEHKVLFYFYFEKNEQITEFINAIKEEYSVESIDDLKGYRKQLKLKEDQSFGVIVSKQSKLGIQRMNLQTRSLIDFAEKFRGKFDGWTLANLTEEIVNFKK